MTASWRAMRWGLHLRAVRAASLALVVTTGSLARAETPAQKAFATGTAAYAKGDFAAAARAFDEANAIAPAPAAVFNAARAWQDAGDAPRAADRYATFLDAAPPDVTQRTSAQRELEKLQKELVAAQIEGPSGAIVAIEHVDRAAVPAKIHLRPGSHIGHWTSASVDGESFTVAGEAGEKVRVVLRAATASRAPPPRMPQRADPPDEPGRGPSGFTIAGATMLVVGAVSVGIGVGVGATAIGARDDFVDGGRTDPDLRAQADDLRTASNVTWVSGAAVGTIGLVLLVAGLTRGDEEKVSRAPFAVRF